MHTDNLGLIPGTEYSAHLYISQCKHNSLKSYKGEGWPLHKDQEINTLGRIYTQTYVLNSGLLKYVKQL